MSAYPAISRFFVLPLRIVVIIDAGVVVIIIIHIVINIIICAVIINDRRIISYITVGRWIILIEA